MRAETPVLPDREEARRWAVEELSKPDYSHAWPGWIDGLWKQLTDWLRSLDGSGAGVDGTAAAPLIGVVIAVLIGVAIVLVRPRLNPSLRPRTDMFDADNAVSSAGYRERAAASAARGDWRAAVVDQFRALVRSAEDRDVIEPRPGRTADEVAGQLAHSYGAAADRLNEAARTFDAIRYGRADADAGDYAAIVDLELSLVSLKPARDTTGTGSFTVPR
ncbi:DUF4129 domain-containing protein [Micrococcaceae bacterium Sec5.7]